MAGLESYSNLSKQTDDLLKKGFCFSQLSAFSIYSKLSQGINIKSSFKSSKQASSSGSVYFQYKSSQFSLKDELQSSNQYKTTLELTPEKFKDLKFKAEVELSPSSTRYTLSAEHSHKKIKSKLAITDQNLLKLSSTFKLQEDKGAGLDLALNPSTMRLTGYNAALWWHASKFQAVLKHISTDKDNYSLGDLSLSGFYTLNSSSKLAAAVTRSSENLGFRLGLQHSPETDRVFKVRFDNEATLGLSLRAKVSPLVTLVTATQFNLFDKEQASYGFRVKINQ